MNISVANIDFSSQHPRYLIADHGKVVAVVKELGLFHFLICDGMIVDAELEELVDMSLENGGWIFAETVELNAKRKDTLRIYPTMIIAKTIFHGSIFRPSQSYPNHPYFYPLSNFAQNRLSHDKAIKLESIVCPVTNLETPLDCECLCGEVHLPQSVGDEPE